MEDIPAGGVWGLCCPALSSGTSPGDRCPPVCPHVHADVVAARAPFPAFCFIGEETGTQRSEVFKAADGVAGWAWGRVLCVYDLCPLWPVGHECDRASRSGGLF